MKKTISLFMVSLICGFSLLHADVTYNGTGTAADPYQIETAEQLDGIRDYLNSASVYFKIMNDIDLTEFLSETANGWEPIGPEVSAPFKGTLDGNGKTIRNLWISGNPDGCALFGRLGNPGVIKNLIIEDADIEAGRWAGILVSSNGTWEYEGGTISNCIVKNSRISGVTCIGTIAGANGSIIENCAAIDVDVSGTQKSVGGLIGENGQSKSLVTNCWSSGLVSSTDEIGGLIGQHSASATNAVENCYSYAYVYGGTNVGGLIGYCNAPVKNCFASGDVEGQSAGGLIGAPLTKNIENCYATGNVLGLAGTDQFSGGLVGAMYDCNATNCYFAGTHEGSARGGFTDRSIRNVFANCYFNATTTGAENAIGEGESYSGDITALTDAEMKQQAKMSGLFTSDAWDIWEGNSYPYFKYQSAPPVLTKVSTTKVTGTFRNAGTNDINIYTLDYGTVEISNLKIENNVWEATIASGQIKVGDFVNVILFEEGKAPSYAVYDAAEQGEENSIKNTAQDLFTIYPNPASDYINITANEYTQLDIFDALGKKVLTKTGQELSSPIFIGNLSSGIYFVQLNAAASATQKLIIK